MKQTVLIGLGGTGSRVVNNVARELQKRKIDINDGIVTCCVLDTNQSDNDLINASGTNIPVIPTCDDRIIDEYLALYVNKDPRRWCPYSSSYGQESMIDGASEIRSKSRIAFMDTMATGKILELQNAIEKVFHNKPGKAEKIRVLLVSSLAGGTGSGMFLQVALWLRKFFAERMSLATIRGIFLLPDIFIRTVPNVRDNPRKKLYHYANAYAAIRELNAINKVVKGNVKLEKPLVIDDLFDSRHPSAKPVFDNAFFIDDVDAGGAAFDSIEAYEEIAAQIVYMQLYAPMQNELISVEDNLFRAFESNPEPAYGSCGTAKAVYPVEDVAEYCALRAAQDAISEGWNKIDSEIDALEQEQADAEKDGITTKNPVNRRDMYVTLFEEKVRKKAEEMGKDDSALFSRIKNDTVYETRTKTAVPGKDRVVTQNKVERFMNFLYERIKARVSEKGGGDTIEDIVAGVPNPDSVKKVTDSLVNKLKGLWVAEQDAIASAVEDFEKNCEAYADEIVRMVVPMDMGSVNAGNERSLYGLFMKKDPEGNPYFVHPVAAKYLLYKLSRDAEVKLCEAFTNTKEDVLAGDTTISFDIAKTAKAETLEKYWKQLGMMISKSEVAHFIRQYKLFNAENKLLCEQYETELLTKAVLRGIKLRVDQLIEEIEKLFKYFPRIIQQYGDALDDNIARNQDNLEKTLYVYAKKDHKEAMYKSLGIDLTGRVEELNKGVIESVYGSFCVKVRPSMSANKAYADTNVVLFFKDKALQSFKNLIMDKHRQEISLTIIQAIEAESDFNFYAEQAAKKNGVSGGEDDLLNAQSANATMLSKRAAAVIACRDRLEQMARPFLIAQPDESLAVIQNVNGLSADTNNAIWMRTDDGQLLHMPFQTRLTFWGFHPQVGVDYPNIAATLGANKTTAANVGYGINELYCYTSIYGVIAEAIPKFNELRGGAYYTNYSAVINSILDGAGEVATPHIDKTWHEFLPYVSAAKEKSVRQKFYKTLWRAIAYGRITLDSNEKFRISKATLDAYGNPDYQEEQLLENGRPIGKTEIVRLISALKQDPAFENIVAKEMEAEFLKDVTGMTVATRTDIIKGLGKKGELNPVTMITRYCAGKGSSASVKADLIGALSEIMKDIADAKNSNREPEQIEKDQIKLCHYIYERSGMASKKTYFGGWLKDFKRMKLAVAGGKDETEEDIL